jgi:hypothetical protein
MQHVVSWQISKKKHPIGCFFNLNKYLLLS